MNDYDFTLTFRLNQAEANPEHHIDKLAENGCDDALIGIGKLGSISLNFTRGAHDALEAITSAIEDVRKAIPDAILVEATPDFVGITDIAEIYGASRQYLRKLIASRSGSFPEPVHEGKPSLWHLADVSGWLSIHEPDRSNATLLEVATINMQVNACRSFLRAYRPTDAPGAMEAFITRSSPTWERIASAVTPGKPSETPLKKPRMA